MRTNVCPISMVCVVTAMRPVATIAVASYYVHVSALTWPVLGPVKYSGSHYEFVINVVRGMIEGTVDVFAFESELHKVLDSSAYMAFTVEKILQNIVRQVILILLLLLLVLLLHPFNGLFSMSAWVSWYQKGKTNLALNEARDDGVLGWQWHQLDHMQKICTSLQTDNHTNISSLNFYRPDVQQCQSADGLPVMRQVIKQCWSVLLLHCCNCCLCSSHYDLILCFDHKKGILPVYVKTSASYHQQVFSGTWAWFT